MKYEQTPTNPAAKACLLLEAQKLESIYNQGHPNIAKMCYTLSIICKEMSDYDEALEYAMKAITIYEYTPKNIWKCDFGKVISVYMYMIKPADITFLWMKVVFYGPKTPFSM